MAYCFPPHVPSPQYTTPGKYKICGIGHSSNTLKCYEINAYAISVWALPPNGGISRQGGDAIDFCLINGGYSYFFALSGEEAKPGTATIELLQDLRKYDCINGACITTETYNTPGLYQSLSDCELACGTGCSGKCISNADWATIQRLATQLKNKSCG